MIFYLGVHLPAFLRRTDVPLFLSFQRLKNRRTLGPAMGPWAVDSGGFTELSTHGRWTISEECYVGTLRRLIAGAGRPDFAAVQDWMCAPSIVERTGLSVREHQERTVASVVSLRAAAPDIPWAPVLQGWQLSDYLRHVEMHAAAGVDLRQEPVVGIGSIAGRQGTHEAHRVVNAIADLGIRLHGLGFKLAGLRAVADRLWSADSMAWSHKASFEKIRLPGHTHAACQNCLEYALRWRSELLESLSGLTHVRQLALFPAAA